MCPTDHTVPQGAHRIRSIERLPIMLEILAEIVGTITGFIIGAIDLVAGSIVGG